MNSSKNQIFLQIIQELIKIGTHEFVKESNIPANATILQSRFVLTIKNLTIQTNTLRQDSSFWATSIPISLALSMKPPLSSRNSPYRVSRLQHLEQGYISSILAKRRSASTHSIRQATKGGKYLRAHWSRSRFTATRN